jgi:glycosyltransferase involved in cell wall biosynthesis
VLVPGEFESKPHNGADSGEPVRTLRVLDLMEATWVSGPAKNLIEFARRAAHANSGPRVQIAVGTFYRKASEASNEFVVACRDAGLDVQLIRERFAFDTAVIPRLREIVQSYNPHIIQTHAVKSHFLVRLCGLHKRSRWIAFHHGYTWTDLKVLLYNQLDRWSLPASSGIVTVCRPFASQLERIGIPKDRIRIRHNTVAPFHPASVDAVAELRRSLRVPDNAKILLTVGRLSREKGQEDAIKALGIIKKDGPARNLRLILVGDGPDRRKLEHTAQRFGVRDSVVFASHQPNVAPFYTMADLMVLPSWSEGSPNVLLEAMAAGLPIVATAVGGVPEIAAATSAARLVPKQSPPALALAIAQVLDDDTARAALANAARTSAAAYSPEEYCAFMLSLYKQCAMQPDKRGSDTPQHRRSTSAPQTKVMSAE